MIRQCCQCGKIYGEKPPFEDRSITSGFCEKCFREKMEEIRDRGKNLNRDGDDGIYGRQD